MHFALRRLVERCIRPSLLALGATMTVAGCMSVTADSNGRYANPVGDAPVTENPTPYSDALVCLARYAGRSGQRIPHVAVARISDLTGQLDENGGRPITQGAMLMAISALGKTGIPLVERYETDVPKLEFDLGNNKLISSQPRRTDGGTRDYRAIYPGQVSGSDYFLTGGVTELNSSIRAMNGSAGISEQTRDSSTSTISGNAYVMNIGMDLRLVDTNSLDIVSIVSYQKQIIGWQVGAGLFSFFGNQVLSINASGSAQEPLHLAVRSLVERAVVEMVTKLYNLPESTCLDPQSDPLKGKASGMKRSATFARDVPQPAPFIPAPPQQECCQLRARVD